jgi:hypothetical protein
MSCHPPTRQVGLYQSEDGAHDEPIQQLALADLHVKPYAKRHIKVYADISAHPRRTPWIRFSAGANLVDQISDCPEHKAWVGAVHKGGIVRNAMVARSAV